MQHSMLFIILLVGQQGAGGDEAVAELLGLLIGSRHANIAFHLGACERVVEETPAGVRADVVDQGGYHYLAIAHLHRPIP